MRSSFRSGQVAAHGTATRARVPAPGALDDADRALLDAIAPAFERVTALLDAVKASYGQLQKLNDKGRINAIVVMTDGLENNSRISLKTLTSYMRDSNQAGVPVVVFAIGYGKDADWNTLKSLSDSTGGQVREGNLETIKQLYKILSTYF